MWIVWWNGNLIDKTCAQPLNGPSRRLIAGVAGNGHGLINCANPWGDGAAGLKRIAMTAKGLMNLKSNVAGTNEDVPGIANSEIDVAHIGAIGKQNAEMISGNELARRVAGNDPDEAQAHLPKSQRLWRKLHCFNGRWRGHWPNRR